jgi:hypothetical protein
MSKFWRSRIVAKMRHDHGAAALAIVCAEDLKNAVQQLVRHAAALQ